MLRALAMTFGIMLVAGCKPVTRGDPKCQLTHAERYEWCESHSDTNRRGCKAKADLEMETCEREYGLEIDPTPKSPSALSASVRTGSRRLS